MVFAVVLAGRLPSVRIRSKSNGVTRHGSVASSRSHFSAGGNRFSLLRIHCTNKSKEDGPSRTEERQRILLADENKTGEEATSFYPIGTSNLETEGPEQDIATLVKLVIFWIMAAVLFGVALGVKDGASKASEYFTGYLLEKSLSVDNLFVFILIFKYFQVPQLYQGRVLSYGIAGAVVFRAVMITLGAATLQRFEGINVFLGLILLYSSYKLFFAEDEEIDLSNNFIVKACQKFIPITSYYDGDKFFTLANGAWKATPLLLTVAVLELSDVAFAIDSIPAVFGVTRDPFIVFSSNIFAILGLRSLYRLISESIAELDYLQPAIGIVLGFIGIKMLLDFSGYHISTEVSLGFVATSLGSGLILSLVRKSD